MHLLVSNHSAEVAAFRRGIGSAAADLDVVENNLSVLSLIGDRLDAVQTLVITEHQDEGVNVDTTTFVRNLVTRLLHDVEIVVVGSPGSADDLPVHMVATIDEAAALVRERAEPVAVGVDKPSNGNGAVHWEEIATVVAAPAEPVAVAEPVEVAEPAATPAKPDQPQAAAVADEVAPPAPPMSNDDPRSLADDIRDWTERNEQQRGQQRPSYQPSLGERFAAMMPSQRRLRAEEATLDAAIRAPRLSRCHSVAVISPKGGVGKSFLTYLVGNILAEVRGDKVVAIDTNPDFGTLADQVRSREPQTVSSLLEHLPSIKHYSDLRRFTSKVESRLEVLAAPADPDVMATIGAEDYHRVYQQLHHYYDTVLFDCGTGFRDDITRFALTQCDQIVLVSAPLFITTGIVIRALGYLNQIGCDLSRVTLAINQVRREKPLDLEYMRSRFGSRLNAITEIPFDLQLNHAMDRGEFLVDRTQPATRVAVKRLASELARRFD